MAEDAIENLHGQILILDTVKKLYALDIMKKFTNAVTVTERRETGLAKVAIRDMPYVMPESDRFNKVLVQTQASSDSSGNFRYQLDMYYTVGDVVVFDKVKDLRLIDISRVRPCMNYSISIPGVGSTNIFCVPVVTPDCVCTGCSKRR
jgi:hypothetical protein